MGAHVGSCVILLIVLAFGLVFLFLMGREVYRITQAWRWPAVHCVIESCSIANHSNNYQLQVTYRYEFAGQTFRSDHLAMHSRSSSDYAPLQKLADTYPEGATALCFVNPNKPAEAILQQDSLWILPFAIIPLIFVVIGGGGLYVMWFGAPGSFAPRQPPLTGKKPNAAWLFAIFVLVGGITFYAMSVRVLIDIASARHWITTPCVIKSSRVQSHSNSKGTTYSIDILFAYDENGRQYRSNHYDFMTGSTSGHDAKEAIVRALPPGMQTVCYVNPNDPTDAVLKRGFTSEMLFGLIPLGFLIIGLSGMVWQIRKQRIQSQSLD